MNQKLLLYFPVIFAALVIFSGIYFGLPLWLVDDEPPYILAALKMIQLETILPALHLDDFKPFLYYPPYLSYLYLPFFVVILGVKYLLVKTTIEQFTYIIAANPSIFFLAARLLVAFLSLGGLLIFYKLCLRFWDSVQKSILATFFLATSFSYLALSMNSRHWLPVTFVFLLSLYFLSDNSLSFKRRYFFAALTLGVGMGVNVISALGVLLLPLWYLLRDKKSFTSAIKDPFVYSLILLFIVLAYLPLLIFPGSLGFSGSVEFANKSFLGLLQSPIKLLTPIALVEPVLIFFAIIGILFAIKKRDRVLMIFTFFVFFYSLIFYSIFYLTHRFAVPLLPFFAIFASYGFCELWKVVSNSDDRQNRIQIGYVLKFFMAVLLFFPIIISLRLGYLSLQNDSRIMARNWIENNVSRDSKMITFSPRLRVSASRAALLEQKDIEASSLRKVDEAEIFLNQGFNVLNLYTVSDLGFFSNLPNYIKKQRVEYLVISPNELEYVDRIKAIKDSLSEYSPIVSFGSDLGVRMPGAEVFRWTWLDLFKIKEFGPRVEVYRIKK